MCSFEVEAQLRARGEGLSRRRNLGAYRSPFSPSSRSIRCMVLMEHGGERERKSLPFEKL